MDEGQLIGAQTFVNVETELSLPVNVSLLKSDVVLLSPGDGAFQGHLRCDPEGNLSWNGS